MQKKFSFRLSFLPFLVLWPMLFFSLASVWAQEAALYHRCKTLSSTSFSENDVTKLQCPTLGLGAKTRCIEYRAPSYPCKTTTVPLLSCQADYECCTGYCNSGSCAEKPATNEDLQPGDAYTSIRQGYLHMVYTSTSSASGATRQLENKNCTQHSDCASLMCLKNNPADPHGLCSAIYMCIYCTPENGTPAMNTPCCRGLATSLLGKCARISGMDYVGVRMDQLLRPYKSFKTTTDDVNSPASQTTATNAFSGLTLRAGNIVNTQDSLQCSKDYDVFLDAAGTEQITTQQLKHEILTREHIVLLFDFLHNYNSSVTGTALYSASDTNIKASNDTNTSDFNYPSDIFGVLGQVNLAMKSLAASRYEVTKMIKNNESTLLAFLQDLQTSTGNVTVSMVQRQLQAVDEKYNTSVYLSNSFSTAFDILVNQFYEKTHINKGLNFKVLGIQNPAGIHIADKRDNRGKYYKLIWIMMPFSDLGTANEDGRVVTLYRDTIRDKTAEATSNFASFSDVAGINGFMEEVEEGANGEELEEIAEDGDGSQPVFNAKSDNSCSYFPPGGKRDLDNYRWRNEAVEEEDEYDDENDNDHACGGPRLWAPQIDNEARSFIDESGRRDTANAPSYLNMYPVVEKVKLESNNTAYAEIGANDPLKINLSSYINDPIGKMRSGIITEIEGENKQAVRDLYKTFFATLTPYIANENRVVWTLVQLMTWSQNGVQPTTYGRFTIAFLAMVLKDLYVIYQRLAVQEKTVQTACLTDILKMLRRQAETEGSTLEMEKIDTIILAHNDRKLTEILATPISGNKNATQQFKAQSEFKVGSVSNAINQGVGSIMQSEMQMNNAVRDGSADLNAFFNRALKNEAHMKKNFAGTNIGEEMQANADAFQNVLSGAVASVRNSVTKIQEQKGNSTSLSSFGPLDASNSTAKNTAKASAAATVETKVNAAESDASKNSSLGSNNYNYGGSGGSSNNSGKISEQSLSAEEKNDILRQVNQPKYKREETDSLWKVIEKAYVRSLPKMLERVP